MKEQKAGKQISGFNNYQKYPKYKVSGVEWLGEIPAHWEFFKLKYLANPKSANAFTDGDWIESEYITDNGIRLIQTGNIGIGEYREQGFRYISEKTFEELDCTELNVGDILICRLADPVGRACLVPNLGTRMVTSVDVCILRAKKDHNKKYLVYFFSSDAYLNLINSISRGSTRDRISRTMLGNIKSLVPPLPEQKSIAGFLDRETEKIDKLIEKKERLIELLEEKRQAIITKAVTKGLDPDVPMKDSGLEWLDEIPEHWGRRRFKQAVSNSTQKGDETLRHYVTLEHILSGEGKLAEGFEWDSKESSDYYLFESGDILFGKLRPYLRKYYLAKNPGCCGTDILVFRPRKADLEGEFLFYLIQSEYFIAHTEATSYGAKMPRTSWEKIGQISIWVPPRNEQVAISIFLDRETGKIDKLISKIKEAIEKLKEYRTALISSVVTGKIDVRDEVNLPTEKVKREVQVSYSETTLLSDAGEK